MKLYEIDEAINKLLRNSPVDAETGEVLIDFEEIENLQHERESKVENIIKYYLNINADISKFSDEIKRLTASKKVLENKANSIKRYIDSIHNGCKKDYGIHKVSYRKSKALIGDNIDVLTDEFIKVTKSVNKTELKKAIEKGEVFEGWEIKENQSIQIK